MPSAECGIAGLEPLGELVQREGLPPCPCQRRYLTREDRARDPSNSELERATDAMVAQYRRTRRGWDLPHQFRNPHSALRIASGPPPARPAPARQRGSCLRPTRTRLLAPRGAPA